EPRLVLPRDALRAGGRPRHAGHGEGERARVPRPHLARAMKAARAAARAAERPAAVAAGDPGAGATGGFADSPVTARPSGPADPRRLDSRTLRVQEANGPVPGRLALWGDACVVVFQPDRVLRPHVIHFVIVSGLLDRAGRSVRPHCSRFVPCDLTVDDLR